MNEARQSGGNDVGADRHLPGHIEAALRRQRERIEGRRNLTDTAGVPWEGRDFEHSMPEDPADDGAQSPVLDAPLARWVAAEADEDEVIAALGSARLFIAAKSEHAEAEKGGQGKGDEEELRDAEGGPKKSSGDSLGDKAADMFLCSVTAPDGRLSIPIFSSVEHLSAWDPSLRPIPFDVRRLALAAVQDGVQLFVLNPGGQASFVVRRPAIWALAKAEPWQPSYGHPGVAQELEGIAAMDERIEAILPRRSDATHAIDRQGRGLKGGGLGPELECLVYVRHGLTNEALSRLMEGIASKVSEASILSELSDSLRLKVLDARSLGSTRHTQ